MDAKQIRSLRPKLKSLLKQFDDCFSRNETPGHLSTYVEGQLSDLPPKKCEPIADAVNMPPRTLQQFLSLLEWDHDLMKAKLQRLVATEYAGPHGIGIIDETGCPKKAFPVGFGPGNLRISMAVNSSHESTCREVVQSDEVATSRSVRKLARFGWTHRSNEKPSIQRALTCSFRKR